MRARRLAFAALCAASVIAAGGYVELARRRGPAAGETTAPVVLTTRPGRPYLLVRHTGPDALFRKLLLVPLSAPQGPGYATALACERAAFAGSRGICLTEAGEGLPGYAAHVFDDTFTVRHRVRLTGLPSRTRLSPDGRFAGITVFETGHSYAGGGFSTRTTILDTATGGVIGDLEQFRITRDGRPFRAVDFNFWGVTFSADGNRFFVTLATGGTHYLVEGDVAAREGRVVRTGVECPSLSPDNARIAYKHATAPGHWQLRVYDRRTGVETALTSEQRSVDDQVEWLDDDHVVYHISGAGGADLWMLRADGSGPPTPLRDRSYSPAVVR
jgi:hypothetical protein